MSLELENDDDVLAAALSFVDEALQQPSVSDGACDDATQSASLAVASSSSEKTGRLMRRKRASGFNPNRARAERKTELVYLRQQVQEMEAKLEELKITTPPAASQSAVSRACGNNPDYGNSVSVVWKAIAERQLAQRQDSEMENIRLRFVLEEQLKVARSLEKILKRQMPSNLFRSPVETLQVKCFNRTHSDYDEAKIFQSLHSWAEAAYTTNLDVIFEANGLNNMEQAFQHVRICPNESREGGFHLELYANKSMPFDLQASSNAVWHHFTRSIKHMPRRVYVPLRREIKSDTVIESFLINLSAKQTAADLHVYQVLRRYVEEDRVVIVWRAILDPIELGCEQTSGVRFFEDGYIVTKRSKTMDPGFSLMQSCFIVTPEASSEEHGPLIGQFSNFFLDSVGRRIGLSHQMIENGLLEEMTSLRTTQ